MEDLKNEIETFKRSIDLFGKDLTIDEFNARKAGRIDALEIVRNRMNKLPQHIIDHKEVKELYHFCVGCLSEEVEL